MQTRNSNSNAHPQGVDVEALQGFHESFSEKFDRQFDVMSARSTTEIFLSVLNGYLTGPGLLLDAERRDHIVTEVIRTLNFLNGLEEEYKYHRPFKMTGS